jgi:hypothetical protein
MLRTNQWFVTTVMIIGYLVFADVAQAAWPQQDKLTALDGVNGDRLGWSVSISGEYAVVGAPYDDDNGTSSGSAYIFKRSSDSNDPNWYEQDKLVPSDNADDDHFGISVSISGDYVIVGASYSDDNGTRSGSAYIFKRSDVLDDPNWYEQDKLIASDGVSYDYFGGAVSISGDYVIIGASWNDGVADKSGSAYIFKRSDVSDDPNWYEQDKLIASDGEAYNYFGGCVSISGDYAIIGRDYGGVGAYIFKNDGTNWNQQVKLTSNKGGEFGRSVSICGDYAIVGAREEWDVNNGAYSGATYIFKRDGISWPQQARLFASDGAPNDYFGGSVSISGDYAVVGATCDDDNGDESGSAYIFRRDVTSWTQQAKLIALDGETGDFFGNSVSISQDYAIVGSVYNGDNGNGAGSAYVFWQVCPTADLSGDCFVDFIELQ